MTMDVITIHQPWPHAIIYLGKPVENRTWRPYERLIGNRIAIHASSTDEPMSSYLAVAEISGGQMPLRGTLPLGQIVATALVAGWVHTSGRASDPSLLPYLGSKWFFGPYGWVLLQVERLERPIRTRGYQRVWKTDLL